MAGFSCLTFPTVKLIKCILQRVFFIVEQRAALNATGWFRVDKDPMSINGHMCKHFIIQNEVRSSVESLHITSEMWDLLRL